MTFYSGLFWPISGLLVGISGLLIRIGTCRPYNSISTFYALSGLGTTHPVREMLHPSKYIYIYIYINTYVQPPPQNLCPKMCPEIVSTYSFRKTQLTNPLICVASECAFRAVYAVSFRCLIQFKRACIVNGLWAVSFRLHIAFRTVYAVPSNLHIKFNRKLMKTCFSAHLGSFLQTA